MALAFPTLLPGRVLPDHNVPLFDGGLKYGFEQFLEDPLYGDTQTVSTAFSYLLLLSVCPALVRHRHPLATVPRDLRPPEEGFLQSDKGQESTERNPSRVRVRDSLKTRRDRVVTVEFKSKPPSSL